MNDLISRQAMLKHIEKIRQDALMMDDIQEASIIMTGMHLCEEAVRNQPSAQPERKNGNWIYKNFVWFCSECDNSPTKGMGYVQGHDELYDFCPHCGADMRERKEE